MMVIVVELDRVGQRDEAGHCRCGWCPGSSVIDPVADVLSTPGTRQGAPAYPRSGVRPGPSQPIGRFAGEALQDVHGAMDHRALVVVLVDRHLIVRRGPMNSPAFAPCLLGDPRVVLADACVDGERRSDAMLLERDQKKAPHADPHAVFVPSSKLGTSGSSGNSGRRRQRPGRGPSGGRCPKPSRFTIGHSTSRALIGQREGRAGRRMAEKSQRSPRKHGVWSFRPSFCGAGQNRPAPRRASSRLGMTSSCRKMHKKKSGLLTAL